MLFGNSLCRNYHLKKNISLNFNKKRKYAWNCGPCVELCCDLRKCGSVHSKRTFSGLC